MQQQQRFFTTTVNNNNDPPLTSSTSTLLKRTTTTTTNLSNDDNLLFNEIESQINEIKIKCRSKTKHKECDKQLQKLFHEDIVSSSMKIDNNDDSNNNINYRTSCDGDDDDHVKNKKKNEKIQDLILNIIQIYSEMNNAHRAEEILLLYADMYREQQPQQQNNNKEINNNNNNNYPIIYPTKPTIEMCLSVLTTWKKSKSSRRGYRAEKFLSLMEKDNILPNPNVACYTAVINCLSSIKNKPRQAQRCELILRSMYVSNIEPNILTYTSVLNAWSRSTNENDNNAPIQCDRIFNEMITQHDIIPDRRVYAVMISAWGRYQPTKRRKRKRNNDKSKQQQQDQDDNDTDIDNDMGIRNAEKYFQLMIDNQIQPTVVEYTALIQAWSNYIEYNIDKSKEGVERVQELLYEMTDKSSSSSDVTKPNTLTYMAVLKTISVARRIPNRRIQANKILKIMTREGVQITSRIENIVRKCNSRV